MKHLLTRGVMVAIVAIVLCTGSAQGVEIDWPEPNWPEIFEPNQLLTFYLEMDPSDWTAILRTRIGGDGCLVEKIEKPAYFWMEGEDANKIRVAVRRKKGFGFPTKGTAEKVALKIDINEYYPKQGDPNNCVPGTEPGDPGYCDPNAATEWHGLKKLSLEVNSDSIDVISEGVAINIHRMASLTEGYGWPVWHGNWVKLYVNGNYIGVYANAEQYDKQNMRNRDLYGCHGCSWLYKYADCEPGFVLKVGDDTYPKSQAVEALCYEPFVNTGDDPDLMPSGGVCPVPNDVNVAADMNQWVNMKRMLSSAAIDAFLANSDGLFESGNNTYFFDPNITQACQAGRKRMYLPWDVDSSFKVVTTDIYYTASSETYDTVILGNPFFRPQYNQIMRDLLDGPLSFADINDFLDTVEPVITDAVAADSHAMDHLALYGYASVAECFDGLRTFFSQRIPNVLAQVDWDEPLMPPGIVLLNDDFNNAVWDANWIGGHNWVSDAVTYAHGSPSAKAPAQSGGYFECNDLDTYNATAIHADFWFQTDDTDAGEFELYYYNGTGYDLIVDLTGDDDKWLHYTDTITDSNYFVPNFRIRFNATPGTNENVWVDEVVITKEIGETPCDAANLDGAGLVNFEDYVILANDWRLTGSSLAGDIDANDVVNFGDLDWMVEYWLSDCN